MRFIFWQRLHEIANGLAWRYAAPIQYPRHLWIGHVDQSRLLWRLNAWVCNRKLAAMEKSDASSL